MGIESDQLVFDYLSRVGDVAHQRQLPSGDRMRLVSSLRNEIDRRRGGTGGDSPAAIRRILGQLGEPEALVRAASGTEDNPYGHADPAPSASAVPESPAARGPEHRMRIPKQPDDSASPPPAPTGPHLVGMDEARPRSTGGAPDWWRADSGGGGRTSPMRVGGFVGGVEIPDILRPPAGRPGQAGKAERDAEPEEAEEAVEDDAPGRGRAWWRRRGTAGRTAGLRGGFGSPFLLVAALPLIAGAILGNVWVLLAGWALAYFSRTLSAAESRFAVFVLPGVSVAGGAVWIWGRYNGRWGEPVPDGAFGDALSGTWPVVVRVAAVATALYLVWRARRGRVRNG